jgi:hypothetical protein
VVRVCALEEEQMSTTTRPQAGQRSSVAVGSSMFAAIMMMMLGMYQAIAGLVALVNDEFFVVGEEWVFKFDATTWGWIHLLIGIVVALAGAGVLTGAVWARTVGVALALLSGLAAFAWLPWYPIWALVLIALDVFVIWALTAHGRDVAR